MDTPSALYLFEAFGTGKQITVQAQTPIWTWHTPEVFGPDFSLWFLVDRVEY